ncbi:MAG: hypothetical protein WD042_16095 [Phycisphaeraceae bacterium]
MTTGGWTIMVLSVGFVTVLLAWCLYKVFTHSATEVHAPPQIDPHDREK